MNKTIYLKKQDKQFIDRLKTLYPEKSLSQLIIEALKNTYNVEPIRQQALNIVYSLHNELIDDIIDTEYDNDDHFKEILLQLVEDTNNELIRKIDKL